MSPAGRPRAPRRGVAGWIVPPGARQYQV